MFKNRSKIIDIIEFGLSTGTHGVISIMVGNTLKNFEGILYPDEDEIENGLGNQTNTNYISNNPEEAKVLIAMMLAFQAGAIQVFFNLNLRRKLTLVSHNLFF